MFTHTLIQAQITENIITPHHWPLWGGFTGDRSIIIIKSTHSAYIYIYILWKYIITLILPWLQSNVLFPALAYWWVDCSSRRGTGCRVCSSQLAGQTPRCGKPPSGGISGWLTGHKPSLSELGQVSKHMALFVCNSCWVGSPFGSVYIDCIFWQSATLEGHLFIFYSVKIQTFDHRVVTIIWWSLKMHYFSNRVWC